MLMVLLWGRARLVEEEGQAGDDGADRDPEPREIALAVPGHDVAEEHHREDRNDQTDELALQVSRRREPAASGVRHSGTQWVARFLARNLPETALRAASLSLTMQPSTAVVTCAVV